MKTSESSFKYPFKHILYIGFNVCIYGLAVWLLKMGAIYLVIMILMSMWLELLNIKDKLDNK